MKNDKLSYKVPYLIFIGIFLIIWLTLLIILINIMNGYYIESPVTKEEYLSFNSYVLFKFIVFMISTFSLLLIFPLYTSFYLYILYKRGVRFKPLYHRLQLIIWLIMIILSVTVFLVYLNQGSDIFLNIMTFGITPVLCITQTFLGFKKIY